MDAAAVGGALLSSFLKVVIERMATREFIDFFRAQKFDDALLEKLKLTLSTISCVLNDAEEKQATNPAVKAWLFELKDAVYAAEDLLDEISTEALRCKLEAKVCNFFSTFLNPFAKVMEPKVKQISERLENIAAQMKHLGLEGGAGGGRQPRTLPTTSLVEESCLYGRDDDKQKIIELLLSDDDVNAGLEISVITIVGMGGVGKTTLAQHVYSESRVKDHFDLTTWICVSERFDVVRLTRTIAEAISSSTSESTDMEMLQNKLTRKSTDLEMLQNRLKEKLTARKFLVVLDDVWNEDRSAWELLQKPFRYGKKGSKIIVTTRNEGVANIMSTLSIYRLKELPDEACWSLFAKHAFSRENYNENPGLKKIGRDIAKKCRGLPLAAKTLGGLLRCENDDLKWKRILKSDIWNLPHDRNGILPALWLSYIHLPLHQKRCFSYCSIYPKGYEFEKQQLILLWMAEDLLQEPTTNLSMEELGSQYFHDLTMRSFFQPSCYNELHYVMHDLVNDMAKFVSGDFCFRLEDDKPKIASEKVRHLSYFRGNYDTYRKFETLYGAKHLRTFLPLDFSHSYEDLHLNKKILSDLLPAFRCLRVLSLSRYSNVHKLPDFIGDFKHLRYLDLAGTSIQKLPSSLITLGNLQTLILSDCEHLYELPANIERLINLRHLDIRGTNIKEMPVRVHKLKNLRMLSTFILGQHSGSRIRGLGELQHLCGKLSILKLENVTNAKDASEANLKGKEYLDELVLEWSLDTQVVQNDGDVLDQLQPNASLKKLTMNCYKGTSFPAWVGDHSFSKMVYLRLSKCRSCLSLPPVEQLPSLKELCIEGFAAVERVGPEFYENGSYALEILRFENMPEWEEWCFGDEGGVFPYLRELYIIKCPKLIGGLPKYLPLLRKLVIAGCQQLQALLPRAPTILELELGRCDKVVLSSNDEVSPEAQPLGFQSFCRLVKLQISHMSELKELPLVLHQLPLKYLRVNSCPLERFIESGLPDALETLFILSCDSLKSFPLAAFPKLNHLMIYCCSNLESFYIPEGFHEGPPLSLNTLDISWCPKLESFPEGGLPTPNLRSFYVFSCKNLKSLPKRMHTLSLLEHLSIKYCPELESFPERGLPSTLVSLTVLCCNKLTARRREWCLQTLPSLKYLHIQGCEDVVESFLELPSTLTSLTIWSFQSLKHMDKMGLQHLTSLKTLDIWGCPKLQYLPKEGLPTSISFLRIQDCPLLEERCQRKRAKDWSKIAHIPIVIIDRKVIP